MNRIELIIAELEQKLIQYWNFEYTRTVFEEQLNFFKSLLEETDEIGVWEIHTGDVKPTVWGMGDVSYHVNLQLNNFEAYSKPIILVVSKQREDET